VLGNGFVIHECGYKVGVMGIGNEPGLVAQRELGLIGHRVDGCKSVSGFSHLLKCSPDEDGMDGILAKGLARLDGFRVGLNLDASKLWVLR